jgi:hypothetical protein
MRRFLTVLCALGCYTATTHSSPSTPQTFSDWSAPVNVGPPINTIYNDNYAVFSRDELTMYFTSDRPGSLGGDDLWFATRESVDSPWQEPQNMGAPINTAYTEQYASGRELWCARPG